MKSAELPKTIKLGPHDLLICDLPGAQRDGLLGQFCSKELTIRLDSSQKKSILADTLVHEIFHALWWTYHLHDSQGQEHIISVMASVWVQIYRDNPTLVDWLNTYTIE